jgi:Domain of unknown function (DUF4760)
LITAWITIRAQKNIARQKAAIDFFLKTEMDPTVIGFYDFYKKTAQRIESMASLDQFASTEDYGKIRNFLNICELIAVRVNKKVFDESIAFEYWGDVLPQSYRSAERLIKYIRERPEHGTRYTYADLEALCVSWEGKS